MADVYENTFFTFTWKIENISFYTGEMDTYLRSPSFKIGTTEFEIFLSSGDWSIKKIGVGVLASELKIPLFIDSELTLLKVDGEVIENYSEHQVLYLFRNSNYLCRKPILFSNEKVLLTFLPQNTLTICWKAYSLGSGEYFFHTIFHQKIIRWDIKDFSKKVNFSKSFQLSSQYFTIYISILQRHASMTLIMVHIIPSHELRLHFGNCTIAAVDGETIYHSGEINILYDKYIPSSPNWKAYVMLYKDVCNLIKNDTLTLQMEFTVGIGEIRNGREPQTKRKAAILRQTDNIDRSPTTSTLQSDMLSLYENSKFCDVTLRTGNASFPVHKNVLCARSTVFCDMFENDTEASRSGVVHIPDVVPDTLTRMLRFLYSNSLENIPWKMASGLYIAADKYRIQSLKVECLSVLKEKLSVANVFDALVMADTHQDEDLMDAVKDFIFDHDEVICSKKWKELEERNPRLTTQLFRAMHFKKKK